MGVSLMNALRKISKVYLILISVFLIIMSLVYSIPNRRIKWHVEESVQQLEIEGVYPSVFFNTIAARLDNYTDSIMLNIAAHADNNRPIRSSMKNPYRLAKESGENLRVDDLKTAIKDKDNSEETTYSRYWHGYLGILRPLLVFFNYTEIRFLNICALFMLFLVVNILLKKELGLGIMISFFFSMMMSMFIIIPMSLQFSSMFYVMLIGMIFILLRYRYIYNKKLDTCLFFIIGGVTSFLDFLTAPLITLGFPLVTYMFITQDNNKTFIINTRDIIKNCFSWGVGYIAIWISKWIFGSLITGENLFLEAVGRVAMRTSSEMGEGEYFNILSVLKNNFDMVFNNTSIYIFMLLVICYVILAILFSKSIKEISNVLPVLCIGIIPIIWYCLTLNHSGIHFWFTYRNLSIGIFSMLAFLSYSIDIKRIKLKYTL